jgi:SAM-dependent methyltransferase
VSGEQRRAQAGSFGAAAAAYEASRPGYPAAALDWLVPDGARRVLDLGAGTGKLTRLLVDRGLEVTAVEPSAGMREQLSLAVPGAAAVLEGSAEDIPLAAASVDAVLVAQAWHWVDPELAVPEVARVLVPGGRLGLVWNIRDGREPWVAGLWAIVDRALADPHDSQESATAPDLPPPFIDVERFEVSWAHQLSPAGLVQLVASRSYVITLPEQQRRELLAEVAGFVATDPALAGREQVGFPYITVCTRARLR